MAACMGQGGMLLTLLLCRCAWTQVLSMVVAAPSECVSGQRGCFTGSVDDAAALGTGKPVFLGAHWLSYRSPPMPMQPLLYVQLIHRTGFTLLLPTVKIAPCAACSHQGCLLQLL